MNTLTKTMAKEMKYIEELRKGIVRVNFTKVDGTGREMYCTRNSDYISKYVDGTPSVDNEDNIKKDLQSGKITVFDCEKNEFRSFKADKVNLFEIYSYNINTKLPNELMKDVYKVFYKKQKEVLENFIVKVLFRKADGSDRILYGTRNQNFIRSLTGKIIDFDDSADIAKDNYVMSLFDLEKGEVRRYKLSRLKDFQLVDINLVQSNIERTSILGEFIFKVSSLERQMYRNNIALGFNGESAGISEFVYFAISEDEIKHYFNINNSKSFIESISSGNGDIRVELEEVLNFGVKDHYEEDRYEKEEENNDEENNEEVNNEEVSGKINKGEVELTIKLDGNLNGAEIKSFRIEGNEINLVLNVK